MCGKLGKIQQFAALEGLRQQIEANDAKLKCYKNTNYSWQILLVK
jgi:hypothetical protein